jgi:hypothetical protein
VPTIVLILLSAVVGCYFVVVGTAAVGFFRTQRAPSSVDASFSNSADAPFVSIIVPVRSPAPSLDELLDTLRDSAYPSDRFEVLVTASAPTVRSDVQRTVCSASDSGPAIHIVEEPEHSGPALSAPVPDRAAGDVCVTIPPTASLSPHWLPALVANTPETTTRGTSAVTYEHNDRFLPRLQALEQVGRTAAALATAPSASPHATAAPDAQIRRPAPAATLGEYVETTGRRLARTVRRGDWTTTLGTTIYWLTHTAVLVAGAAALLLPAWRQPVLLAFLAKMGIDLVLAVPAARHFGQRELLRSVVPTELFLLLAVPASGLLGGWVEFQRRSRPD